MPYNFIREIGRGGFGVVEEVLDDQGNRFARKKLNPPSHGVHVGVSEEQLKKRFIREVRQQSAITHPNIVRIIEYDLEADPPNYVMPLAERTLKEEIDLDRTLGGDPQKALFDILSGLEALHALGFSHRDLKPANILYYNDGNESYYAISDFGLVTGSDSQTTTLTASGAGGGTAYYAAPECVNNFHRATNRSDIYSFGAILHDIFGGGQTRIPYSPLTVQQASVAEIVEKCTLTNPHRRYSNVAELRDELYVALNNEELTFTSQEQENLVSLLMEKDELSDDEWDRLCVFLEDNENDDLALWQIFRQLSLGHISNLLESSISVFHAVGHLFCNYALSNEGEFGFDYCDVLAGKLREFFSNGDVALQSKALISLMVTGASHNRWHVERIFWVLITDPNLADNTLNRFCIDVDILNIRLPQYINHITKSINVDRQALPEKIQNMILASE